jgi:hypothetical protein
MSTEAKEVQAPKVNRNAVSAIASAIAKGLSQVNATGSLLTQVCKIAHAQFRGKEIPKQDIDAVLVELASTQKWKAASVAVRQSEYRSVLQKYAQLEETMKAFQARMGKCTWHDGIALSRLLRKKGPVAAAIAHAKRGKTSKAENPANVSRSDAKASLAQLVKRVLKFSKLERELRDGLRELCAAYGVKV